MYKNLLARTVFQNPVSQCLILGLALLPLTGRAVTVTQTVNAGAGVFWNTALWGTPAAIPTAGNDYATAAGLTAASATSLNGISVTGRVRDNGSVFAGGRLIISPPTELLLKNGNNTTSTANILLNGGVIRLSSDAGVDPVSLSATLAGTLDVDAESYIGLVRRTNSTLNIASTLIGSSILHLAAASDAATTPVLTISLSGDLSAFTGTLNLGGGSGAFYNVATLDFNQDYNLSLVGLVMGAAGTADILNLDQNLTFGSFTFGATSLSSGTYTAADLNPMFGNGAQFTGSGTLTVVPEPTGLSLILTGLLIVAIFRSAALKLGPLR